MQQDVILLVAKIVNGVFIINLLWNAFKIREEWPSANPKTWTWFLGSAIMIITLTWFIYLLAHHPIVQ